MDVKTDSFHGNLDEELYMLQPEGFPIPGKGHLVCKLRRSLYRLKQALHLCYKKFDYFMLSNGFTRSTADPCLYLKKETNSSPIILVLYVDGMLIIGKHETILQELQLQIQICIIYERDRKC